VVDAIPPTRIDVPSRRFTPRDVEAYGGVTNDHNPIHTDREFAAHTTFGQPIVYGTLLLAPIWGAMEIALGPRAIEGACANARFLRPVAVGSSVHFQGRLVSSTAAEIRYEFTVKNEDGECAATVEVWVPRTVT
jgi:acyl dehydratase